MKHYFSRSFFLLSFLFSLNLLYLPLPANAALVPCGRSEDDPTTAIREDAPCTVCHLVLGTEGIIQWGLKVMTYIAIAVIVAMGILYIVSAGNEGLMETAKKGITASLIGFAVMLGAWLIVNTVLMAFVDTSDPSKPLATLRSQGVFRFTCDVTSNAGSATGVTPDPGTIIPSGRGPGTPTGTGQCAPAPANTPCSVENLRKTCFGANAEMASAICMAESGGSALLPSGVDRCQPGREPASWGLFQINLSANTIGGLSCPATTGAFDRMYTASNKVCSVREPTYASCVAKAKDAAANIQKACELSQNGTRWGLWGANRKCGFPR